MTIDSQFTKGLRLTSVRYPNGRLVHHTYGTSGSGDDNLNRLAAIKDDSSGSPGATLAAYTYLGLDRVVIQDLPEPDIKLDLFGGTSGTYAGLDRFDRVVDQAWTDYGANPDAVLDEYTYEYDRVGNRTAKANELSHDFDETYDYDSLDRLVSAERENGFDQSWTLDGLGNFSGFDDDGSSQTRTANATNEITGITGGWVSPAYDAVGNMISGPKPGIGTTRVHYLYDAWNRLVVVKADDSGDPGGTWAEYQYDGINRRIQKVVTEDGGGPSEAHYFYNQSWQLLEERFVDDQGATVASNQYVWSLHYVDALIVRFHDGNGDGDYLDTSDNTRYYTCDANHSVTSTIDATTGDVVERYVYTAYGTATVYSPTWTNPTIASADGPLYCGYFFDAETALYQVRNRFYDSSLSIFITRDPIGYSAGVNLYEYCSDDPLDLTDPTGEDDWKPSDCPTTCKDHYGSGLDQGALDRLAKKLKAGGGNVGDVTFSSDCGETAFSLQCNCQIGTKGKKKPKPVYKTVICINTSTFSDTCSAMQALEHEFYHAQHGPNEDAAYRKSCQIQAQQECWKCSMTLDEMRKKIDQCVKDGAKKSTGPVNEATIKEGCKKLCDKYLMGQ